MAKQNQSWEQFYESAWEMRRKTMEKFIQEGDKDPFSVIQKFYRYSAKRNTFTNCVDNATEAREEINTNLNQGNALPTGKPVARRIAFLDKYYPVPYYHDPVEFILDYIQDKPFDAFIELGCGYARNLIELFYRGGPRYIPYYAGEYTKSGMKTAQMLAELRPDMKLKPFHFDHKNPDLSYVAERNNVLIFTVHSIEQVTEIPDDYFKRISGFFNKATAIHFEPFGFQLQEWPGEPSEIQRAFILEKQWNLNFAKTILDSDSRKEIKLVYMVKNIMGGSHENPTSIAMWVSPVEEG
ncbi:hypothetical protein D4S03_10320 [bacterium]|nr:MAG: hypothetical protein D4S03_10320 [bacterium]